MDRLALCNEICKIIRISRADPGKNFLTKRELLCIHSHLSAMESQCGDDQTDN